MNCANPCTESIPAYLSGAFTLYLQREGGAPRNIGNIVVGNLQEQIETFIGTTADGSDPNQQTVIQVRQAVNLIATADEIVCENLRDWLQSTPANITGGQRLPFTHVEQKTVFRAIAEIDLCNGTSLQIVIHRCSIVSAFDLLFQPGSITGNQFTLQALRDSTHPTNPYGYLEIVPGGCSLS